MKLGIIDSAFEQAGVDRETGLDHIARIGFDCVDLFVEACDFPEESFQRVKARVERLGLPVVSLPVVACGLVDFNAPVRKFHVDRVHRFSELAARFGGRNLLLVLGEYLWQREVIPPEAQWAWGVEGVCEIGRRAADLGLEIALELEPFRLSLLNSIPSMVRFLDDVALPNVKANIDISHLVLADTGPGELEPLRGKACHVHISDCDGRTHGDLPPGRGIVKFTPYLRAIRDLGFDGVVSIELEYPPDPSRIVEWVEEAYTTTAALMREAGLRDG